MNVYLHTFGCQMNFLEAELLRSVLADAGMRIVTHHDEADVAIVNGCMVREHAEARAVHKVTALRREGVPIVGVIGCLARREGGVASADFAVSPEHYDRLPEVISRAGEGRVALSGRSPAGEKLELVGYEGAGLRSVLPRVPATVGAWVAISQGCDNFCSYCVVPHARGRQVSRAPAEIVREIESLASAGCREVILLGQNVNSYRWGDVDFPALLERVDEVALVPRVRFLTSHPRDMGRRTLEVMAASVTVCPHLHLPLQAGSDPVLERMNRGYTAGEYRSLVQLARELMPHVGLTTDLMVGFPGEDESDFRRTLAMVREIEFDSAFTFGYSRRGGTSAASMAGSLPRQLVQKRLETLICTVRKHAARRLARRVGSVVEVLVEGESPKNSAEYAGRSREGNVVVLPRGRWLPGDTVAVRVCEVRAFTLFGVPLSDQRQGHRGGTDVRARRLRFDGTGGRAAAGEAVRAVTSCMCTTHHGGVK